MNLRWLGRFAVILPALARTAFAQSPPVNDNFTNRTVVSGSAITFAGTLAGATLENGEPTTACYAPVAGGSVWWSWAASQSAPVTIALTRDYGSDSSPTGFFEVFTGSSLASLIAMDCNRLDGPAGRYVEFSAAAGTPYQIRVSGGWSGSFNLHLTATNSPVIVAQPASCTTSPYGSAAFSVVAAGLPAPAFQWRFNGNPLAGQTSPLLIIHNVTTNQTGSYSVIINNSGGVTASAVASLALVQTNPVPRLQALPLARASRLDFTLTGEGGRWYEIQTTPDLGGPWLHSGLVLCTNGIDLFSTATFPSDQTFVRSLLSWPTDVCVGQLKQLRAAKDLWALEHKRGWADAVGEQDVAPYLPGGIITPCPAGGNYFLGDVNTDPVCSLRYTQGHVLSAP